MLWIIACSLDLGAGAVTACNVATVVAILCLPESRLLSPRTGRGKATAVPHRKRLKARPHART